MNQKPFVGPLAIPFPRLDDLVDAVQAPDEAARIKELFYERHSEEMRRLRLLQIHFEVPEQWTEADRWKYVVWELAKLYVPGFQEEKRRKPSGRKGWGRFALAHLVMTVDERPSGKSISWALQQAVREPFFRDRIRSMSARDGDPSEALKKHYQKASKDPGVQATVNARRAEYEARATGGAAGNALRKIMGRK